LRSRQPVGDECPVRLHGGVVAGVEEPEPDHGQPQNADKREYKQDDRTEERANGDERAAAAPPRAPGPITGRADQRLYHQSRDRSGQVQDRELVGTSADQEEERIHRRLGEAEAELDSEEPEIHHQDGGAGHQWFALDLPSVRRD